MWGSAKPRNLWVKLFILWSGWRNISMTVRGYCFLCLQKALVLDHLLNEEIKSKEPCTLRITGKWCKSSKGTQSSDWEQEGCTMWGFSKELAVPPIIMESMCTTLYFFVPQNMSIMGCVMNFRWRIIVCINSTVFKVIIKSFDYFRIQGVVFRFSPRPNRNETFL